MTAQGTPDVTKGVIDLGAARVERHPFGRELVIAFEGPGRDDVLETRYERVNFSLLEQRADELRELLAGKDWSELRNGGNETTPENSVQAVVRTCAAAI